VGVRTFAPGHDMDSSQNYHRRHHSVFSRLLLGFLPRDTMLARYMLSSRVRLSVHPSVTNRYCIETTGRIELVSAWRLSSTYPTLCHKEIYEISQHLGTSLWDFVPNSGLRKFRHGKSIALSTTLIVVASTVEFVDDTYTTIDESWLLTTSRSTVTL